MSTAIRTKNQPVGSPAEFTESDFLELLAEIPGMPGAAKRLIGARLDALDAELGQRLETLARQNAERLEFEQYAAFGAPSTTDDRFVVSNDGMPF